MACLFQYLVLVSFLLVLASVFAHEERQKKEELGRKDELKTHNVMVMKDNRRKPSLRNLHSRSYQAKKKPADSSKSDIVYKPTTNYGTVKILKIVNEQKIKGDVEGHVKLNKRALIKDGLFKRYVQSRKAKAATMEVFNKEHDRTIPAPFIESKILQGEDEYELGGDTELFSNEHGTQDIIFQNSGREKMGNKIKAMTEGDQNLQGKERAHSYVSGVKESWKARQEEERGGYEIEKMLAKEKVIDGKIKIVEEGMESEGTRKQEEHSVNVEREGNVDGAGVQLKAVNEGGRGMKRGEEGKYAIHRVGREKEGLFGVTKEKVSESQHTLNSRKQQGNKVQIEEQDKAVLRGINDRIASEMIIDRVKEGGQVMTGTQEENREGIRGRIEEYRKVDGKEIEGERMEIKKGEDTLGSRAVLAALSEGMIDKLRMMDRVKEGERMIARNQEGIEEKTKGYSNQGVKDEYMGSGTQENWMEKVLVE